MPARRITSTQPEGHVIEFLAGRSDGMLWIETTGSVQGALFLDDAAVEELAALR